MSISKFHLHKGGSALPFLYMIFRTPDSSDSSSLFGMRHFVVHLRILFLDGDRSYNNSMIFSASSKNLATRRTLTCNLRAIQTIPFQDQSYIIPLVHCGIRTQPHPRTYTPGQNPLDKTLVPKPPDKYTL